MTANSSALLLLLKSEHQKVQSFAVPLSQVAVRGSKPVAPELTWFLSLTAAPLAFENLTAQLVEFAIVLTEVFKTFGLQHSLLTLSVNDDTVPE